jgi:hypothetical protein
MISKVKEFCLEQKIQVGESIYVVTSFPTKSMICLNCELPAVSEPSGMKISIADLRRDFLSGKAKFHLQVRGTVPPGGEKKD